MYKVQIVEDHILVSDALKQYIDSYASFKVISQLSNGKELQDYIQSFKEKPDLILLDINMPILNGIDTMKWIKSEGIQDYKILALSMDNREETMITMLRLGVNGYILKDSSPQEFKTALEETLDKGYYYSDRVTQSLMNSLNESQNKLETIDLSERENAFLQLACTDLTYKEIASKMFLSPKTIDGYRESLFCKFKVKSRVGMVVYAIVKKLVTINDKL